MLKWWLHLECKSDKNLFFREIAGHFFDWWELGKFFKGITVLYNYFQLYGPNTSLYFLQIYTWLNLL